MCVSNFDKRLTELEMQNSFIDRNKNKPII